MVEEFTFPSVVPPKQHCDGTEKLVSFPRFGISPPPPWFVVSGGAGHAAAEPHDHHRRCFSAVEYAKGRDDDSGGCCYSRGSEGFAAAVVEEHRMDMLWEDFNEELARAAPPPCPISREWASEAWLPGDSRHVVVTGSVVRRRRLSLMMMLKLLRKLFLARKSKATSSLPQGGRRHQSD